MAKKAVVEIQCERCPRKEYVDADAQVPGPALKLSFAGKEVAYDDLCSSCRKAIEGHVSEISKKLGGRSPERQAKKKAQPAAAPSPAAPQPAPPKHTTHGHAGSGAVPPRTA